MKYDDNRKIRLCKCGKELGIFGYKCDECKSKTIVKRKYYKKVYENCYKCHKEPKSGMVEYEGGIMHKSCWLKSL